MRLLVMLVPMMMIGCDGSRESFTIAFDADANLCLTRTPNDNCSCPSGFSVAGWSNNGGNNNSYKELVCLQD